VKQSVALSKQPVSEHDAQGGSDKSPHVAVQQMVIIGVDQMECNIDEVCGLHAVAYRGGVQPPPPEKKFLGTPLPAWERKEMYSNFQSVIPKRQDLSCYDPSTPVLVSKRHVVKERLT
jgi:hypothetical protein